MEKGIIYYVAVYPDEKGHFMMTFPDFPDMAADYGRNFQDCIISGRDFLNDVICEMVENGESLPEPTDPQHLREKIGSDINDLLCIVPVTVYPPAKTERINITGKGDVFARINDFAKMHHITRSELMITATLNYINANQ